VHYWLAVVVYVGTWAAALLTPLSDATMLAVLAVTVVSLGAGIAARAWSIVPLSLVILPLAVAQPCELECDTTVLTHAIVLWTPASAALLAGGVAAGLRLRDREA
jgi:hypothetical protein